MMRVKVALCDDSSLVRSAWTALLESMESVELVAVYATGDEACRKLTEDRAQVLLLDVRMPDMSGLEVAATLRGSGVRIIYLTAHPELVSKRMATGAQVVGALTKDVAPEDLERMISLAVRGFTLFSPSIPSSSPREEQSLGARLSLQPHEEEVLHLVCRGMTNEQIARRLNRSLSSVKQIVGRLVRRAGVANRTQLALYVTDPGFDLSVLD